MASKDPKVDAFLKRATRWKGELTKLRAILLDCGLDESLKWGKPCYGVEDRNVAILQPFQKHCALMFFQGALLEDTHGMLRSQGANTRSAMRLEFTSEKQIVAARAKAYVKQAIAVARSGRKVAPAKTTELELPAELSACLRKDRALARAFRALTPGRQRGYALHIAGAVQSKTRLARIERCRPSILAGKGLHD